MLRTVICLKINSNLFPVKGLTKLKKNSVKNFLYKRVGHSRLKNFTGTMALQSFVRITA